MALSLEEAKTLDALARYGSISKAAASLHKSGPAVVYTLASIEAKVGVPVFDRSKYRTRLLPAGERLRQACQGLLQASDELDVFCRDLAEGHEADLRIVIEGIVPLEPLLKPVRTFIARKIPTRVHVTTEFLADVERTYREKRADFMVSLLPPEDATLESVSLPEIPAFLVVHRDSPLAKTAKTWTVAELKSFSMLSVRGSDPKLNTATAKLEREALIHVSDFHSKKSAILQGLGYGWLPAHLIARELKSGVLRPIRWTHASRHVFRPRLYYKSDASLGRSGRIFLELVLGGSVS